MTCSHCLQACRSMRHGCMCVCRGGCVCVCLNSNVYRLFIKADRRRKQSLSTTIWPALASSLPSLQTFTIWRVAEAGTHWVLDCGHLTENERWVWLLLLLRLSEESFKLLTAGTGQGWPGECNHRHHYSRASQITSSHWPRQGVQTGKTRIITKHPALGTMIIILLILPMKNF